MAIEHGRNAEEVQRLLDLTMGAPDIPGTGFEPVPVPDEDTISAEQSLAEDVWFTQQLDLIYEQGANPDMLEEDEEENDDADADVAPNATFAHYMPELDELTRQEDLLPEQLTPTWDALNNQYVRVIHSNGVHHIALVSCSCQGSDRLPLNLMYAGFVPSSFKQVWMLFTTGVLDFFRYLNLEMKASAYQFFQLLR